MRTRAMKDAVVGLLLLTSVVLAAFGLAREAALMTGISPHGANTSGLVGIIQAQ